MNLRRKRLRLMRDTQWRGYARTAEGNPITLSQVRSVAALSVLGNSSQSGTPSPDNPVEVVGTGERTGNLFDISSLENGKTGYVEGNNIYVIGYPYVTKVTPEKFLKMTGLKEGDTITTYADLTSNMDNACYIVFPKLTTATEELTNITLHSYGKTRTVTIPKDFNSTNYNQMYIYAGGKDIESGLKGVYRNVMIVNGNPTEQPPYEPFGYKVAVQAQGRNLFDFLNGFNDPNYKTSNLKYSYLKLKPNTEYTVFTNLDKDITTTGSQTCHIWALVGHVNTGAAFAYNGVYIGNPVTLMSDINGYITIATRYNDSVNYKLTADDIQSGYAQCCVVEGEYTAFTLPPYEPYKEPQSFNLYAPEPLHGVGDVHDSAILNFDKRKAELVKQYEYFKVDTTTWTRGIDSYDGINSTNRYHIYTNLYIGEYSANDSKCDILQKYNGSIWTTDTQGFTWNGSQLHLRINNDVLGITADDTVEERTSKFTEYIQSNNIYALGKLATPTTADITSLQDWDALPQLKGTWILTATGVTEPMLRAEYYSEERSTE